MQLAKVWEKSKILGSHALGPNNGKNKLIFLFYFIFKKTRWFAFISIYIYFKLVDYENIVKKILEGQSKAHI